MRLGIRTCVQIQRAEACCSRNQRESSGQIIEGAKEQGLRGRGGEKRKEDRGNCHPARKRGLAEIKPGLKSVLQLVSQADFGIQYFRHRAIFFCRFDNGVKFLLIDAGQYYAAVESNFGNRKTAIHFIQ